jgi:hypothetical protein
LPEKEKMDERFIYKDSLLEIAGNKLILKNYYFPSMRPKEIEIGNIKKVEVKEPSVATGKYRFHGTGNILTWYPMDMERYKRDKIFIMFLKTQRIRIGFTCENSAVIEGYFRDRGLLL